MLVATFLLALVFQAILVMGSPAISRDGITFISMARDMERAPADAMRTFDQHPGFPAMVIFGRLFVLPFVSPDSIFSWIWGARLVDGAFGLLVIAVVWLLARRVFDARAAVIAAFIVSILPIFRRNAADALSDQPHLFFYLAAIWLAFEGISRRQWKWFAASGAASGIAYWIRPEGMSPVIVITAILPMWAWGTRCLGLKEVLLWVGFLVLAALIVSAPYPILTGKLSSKMTVKEYPLLKTSSLAQAENHAAGTVTASRVAHSVDGPAHFLWVGANGLLSMVCQVAQGLRWVLVVPLVAGLFLRDCTREKALYRLIIRGMVIFHASLLIWLYYAGGYIAGRHAMPITIFAVMTASAGTVLIADWFCRAILYRGEQQRERARVWLIGAFLAALTLACLPWTLERLNASSIPAIEAAMDLQARAKPEDEVLSNSAYVPFYSQIPGMVISKQDMEIGKGLPHAGTPYRFVVLDAESSPYDKAWGGQLSGQYEPLCLPSVGDNSVRAFVLRPGCSTPGGASRSPDGAVVIVLDPGHGGMDPGTRSRTHVLEKDVTLAVALAAAANLRHQGLKVVLTRDSDTFVSLDERVALANCCGAALFLSIHCDSSRSTSANGFSVLTPRRPSKDASRAACAISQSLESAGVPRHALRHDRRRLEVLAETRPPAVLVEIGFLSNPREAASLADSAYQRRLAGAIASGVADYLKSR